MARTRTLLQLRTECREDADMVGSTFVTDDELTRRLNNSIAALYNRLTLANGEEYFRTPATLVTVAGTATVAVPSDFFRLCSLDYAASALDVYEIQPLEWSRRNEYLRMSGWQPGDGYVRYLIERGLFRFFPTPAAVHNVTCAYIPHATVLSADGDTFDGYNGFERWVVCHTVIGMLNKEESDIQGLLIEHQQLDGMIDAMAQRRDHNAGGTVRDVRRRRWSRSADGWEWDGR